MINIIKDFTSIPLASYQGYLWYSNDKKPTIINDQSPKSLTEILTEKGTTLPFIIEGMLFDKDTNTSIRIVSIDGSYRISQMKVPKNAKGIIYFCNPKKFDGFTKIEMYQHFEPIHDPLNDNLPVLQPTWTAFLGFKK